MKNSIIHIDWEGPLSFENLPNDESDIGLYQVYGTHPVYGHQSLLYIGQTTVSFKQRLSREPWHWVDNYKNAKYYIGKINNASIKNLKKLLLAEIISIAESILILTHAPGCNASGVQSDIDGIRDFTIYNWGNYNMLMPAVVADRYHSDYWTTDLLKGNGSRLKF